MYQDASTNSFPNTSSTEDAASTARDSRRTSESGQISTGSYAERLMDDLFQEVENLLDVTPSALMDTDSQEESFSSESEMSEEAPQTPPFVENLSKPPTVAPTTIPVSYPTREPSWQAVEAYPSEPAIAPIANREQLIRHVPYAQLPRESSRSYDRLLLGVGCVSVVVSLALWLLYQEGKHRQVAISPTPAQTNPTATETNNNRQFADYLQKALRNIDQKASRTASTQLPNPNPNPTGSTPTVTLPKTSGVAPLPQNRVSTGLERIYVPVYQIPPNLYPPGTPIAPLPAPASNKKAPAPPTPTVGQTRPSPAPQVKPSPVAAAPAITRKLVGVFDQGDRSAALIETNGVTQRYQIGESVGSSGWTLVDVTKDQAIIRRNGEVRSLFVGHGF